MLELIILQKVFKVYKESFVCHNVVGIVCSNGMYGYVLYYTCEFYEPFEFYEPAIVSLG